MAERKEMIEDNGVIKNRERGFTLFEIVFVLAIILILVALTVPVASEKLRDAQLARARAEDCAAGLDHGSLGG